MIRSRLARALTAIAALLVLLAAGNAYLAQMAERAHPPTGQFMTIDDVQLHYVEAGQGPPLVLLHGNGAMVEDFQTSGLMAEAARTFRVIAFDRPGFGHSTRPRSTTWTPEAQADLIYAALARLGVAQAIVLGHSWGALVAVTLAVDHPELVTGLVLEAGYFYQSPRMDVRAVSLVTQPGIDNVLSYTVTPLFGRLLWAPIMSQVFGPDAMPAKFEAFPKDLALRPSQLYAATEELVLLNPGAAEVEGRYGELTMPVAILVGDGDRLIDPASQSERLHLDIRQSTLRVIPRGGHMVHQTATDQAMAAIAEVAAAAEAAPPRSPRP